MEFLAILAVLVGGFGFLAVRRHWLDSQDAALNESAGDGWRVRSELPHDAGYPYSDFAPDLFFLMPLQVMEGTEEGFEVAYFTIADGGRSRHAVERPAAIVQVPVETPKFRYFTADLDDDAAVVLRELQQRTPPHYENGRPGRVGPATAGLLSLARSVVVETSPFTVFVRSRGARAEDVSRLTIGLAKAVVADAKASAPFTPGGVAPPDGPR
jgi:hypothetical protein